MIINCRICKQPKNSETDFYKDKSKKLGVRYECKSCAKNIDKERNKKNKEQRKIRARSYYLRNREQILSRVSDYYQNRGGKEKERQRNQKLEQELFLILGDKCQHCGINDHLTIDHINNDGSEERKFTSKGQLVRALLSDADKRRHYQLLCHNCNERKHILAVQKEALNKPLTGIIKFCPTCQKHVDTSLFYTTLDGLNYECNSCDRQRRQEVKVRVINLLGGRCVKCYELDIDKLTVDHIEPVGNDREKHGVNLYRAILSGSYDKEKFQILCFNCNQEKSGANQQPEKFYYATFHELKQAPISESTKKFKFAGVKLSAIDLNQAAPFLDTYHYDKYGRSAKQNYGAWLNDKLIAVVKFCSQGRQGTANSLGFQPNQILELDRFCIHPEYHKKNFASWVLSRINKLITKDFKNIICLVAFADPLHGHDGTVYKAANWEQSGKTAKSYYYEDDSGKIIKKKTFYNWIRSRKLNTNKTEFQVAREFRLKRIITPPKLRFIYRIKS